MAVSYNIKLSLYARYWLNPLYDYITVRDTTLGKWVFGSGPINIAPTRDMCKTKR